MVKAVRDTPLDRTARLLNLVPYLLSHQGIEINSLAKIFEIPLELLIQDLNTLWMCGLPGYTPLELMDLTFDNGFVTISNAETLQRPRSLTRDEGLALILGLDYLSGQIADSTGSLHEALTGLTGKIATSLGEAAQSQVRVSSNISAITRALIIKTIAERGSLLITYHSLGRDVISERKIHPLEFTFENEGEHLFAYCESSQGHRTFTLERILAAQPATSSPAALIWPSAVDSNLGVRDNRVEISITSRWRDVAERFSLNLEPLENMVEAPVQIESFSADWNIREIMSFGGEVQLLAPAQERNLLLERTKRALEAYLTVS